MNFIAFFSLFFIRNFILSNDIEYIPFKNVEITYKNTIYGTGNKLIDTVCNSLCNAICNKTQKEFETSNTICCKIENIENIECLSDQECLKLLKSLNDFIIKTIIACYFAVLFITIVIMFLTFYCLSINYTKDNPLSRKQSLINGSVAGLLVLFTGLILPIIILKIICLIKKKSITRILGGEFTNLSLRHLLFSVEIKNIEKIKKYESQNDNQKCAKIYTSEESDTHKKLNLKDNLERL